MEISMYVYIPSETDLMIRVEPPVFLPRNVIRETDDFEYPCDENLLT